MIRTAELPCIFAYLGHLASFYMGAQLNTISVYCLLGATFLSYFLCLCGGNADLEGLGEPTGDYSVGVKRIWAQKTG